ncbi:MAG: hypothetical protein ACFCU6_12640 [Balneolaceae bacterium]
MRSFLESYKAYAGYLLKIFMLFYLLFSFGIELFHTHSIEPIKADNPEKPLNFGVDCVICFYSISDLPEKEGSGFKLIPATDIIFPDNPYLPFFNFNSIQLVRGPPHIA